tara:strand:- start:1257 stop:2027 length:771 start_codon:yes stop_codon:yes gene_type:complete
MTLLVKENIVQALSECGISKGAVVMLHADAIFLAQTIKMKKEDRYQILFDAFDEVLCSEGTLIMPSFTYSATKNEPFHVETTPSAVGGLSEYFRKMSNVFRSSDPNFSVLARGLRAKDFSNVSVDNAFGPNSAFGLANKLNAWLVCLACSMNRITFTHYVEQTIGVRYRYIKNFPFEIVKKNIITTGETKYYVRDLTIDSRINLSSLKENLIKKNKLKVSSLNRFSMMAVKCNDFRLSATEIIKEYPFGLINQGFV